MEGNTKLYEDFKKKAILKFGNKYDYSLVIYINNCTKIIIICPLHGKFLQTPQDHLRRSKYGCPKCNGRITNTEEFIVKAKSIHGDYYDYSIVEYKNSHMKIEIICKLHGIFKIAPNDHLSGKQGCYNCGKEKTKNKLKLSLKEFIVKANLVHKNKYLYDLVTYKNYETKILILCEKHGVFKQTPHNHLKGKGCRKCMKNNYSRKQIKWLESIMKKENIHIKHAENGGEFEIPWTRLKADGYCKETNTIFEYNGCVFHACLKCYKPYNFNP